MKTIIIYEHIDITPGSIFHDEKYDVFYVVCTINNEDSKGNVHVLMDAQTFSVLTYLTDGLDQFQSIEKICKYFNDSSLKKIADTFSFSLKKVLANV